MVVPDPSREEIREALLDPLRSIEQRYRALLFAKTAPESMCEIMLDALKVQKSILLRHEIAYVLGQIGDLKATTTLRDILLDEQENEIVRHEAAEALGALRVHCSSLAALADETSAVGQTCLIALKSAQLEKKPCPCQYTSTDPALGVPGSTVDDVPEFARILLDETLPLWPRYIAMFTLRNVGGSAAVDALCVALLEDTSSDLLRHEVAFVIGQMEDERATTALIASLGREEEHSMVRHEAAIALGSIGGEKAMKVLKYWSTDKDDLVAESCLVAMETIKYWDEWDALEAQLKEA